MVDWATDSATHNARALTRKSFPFLLNLGDLASRSFLEVLAVHASIYMAIRKIHQSLSEWAGGPGTLLPVYCLVYFSTSYLYIIYHGSMAPCRSAVISLARPCSVCGGDCLAGASLFACISKLWLQGEPNGRRRQVFSSFGWRGLAAVAPSLLPPLPFAMHQRRQHYRKADKAGKVAHARSGLSQTGR